MRDVSDGNVLEIVVIGLLLAEILLAGAFIAGEILPWFGYGTAVFLLYLAWRLVRAIERVADAMEIA